LNNLIQIFRQEVEGNLKQATEIALSLEKQPGSRQDIEALMRVFHSLKGASGAVGFDREKELSHRLEDCFHAVLNEEISYSSALTDLTLSAVDALNTLLQARLKELPLPDNQALYQQIASFLENNSLAETNTQADTGFSLPENLDLAAIFKLQAEGHIENARSCLEQLQKDLADSSNIEQLRRLFHTLKGAARAIGFAEIRELAGELEGLIYRYEESSQPLSDNLLQLCDSALNWISALLAARVARQSPPDHSAILTVIQAFDDQQSPDYPAAPSLEITETASQTPEKTTPAIAVDSSEENNNRPFNLQTNTSIDYRQLDKLHNLSGELLVSVTALGEQRSRIRRFSGGLATVSQHLSRLSHDLQHNSISSDSLIDKMHAIQQEIRELNTQIENLTDVHDISESRFQNLVDELGTQVNHIRLLPLSLLFDDYQRVVRNLARELGKQVSVNISGAGNRIDRAVLESIRSPLIQLIRNAVDHGIEDSESRKNSAKPVNANLTIRAIQMGGIVRITVTDDGRGIDPQRLKKTVLERQLTSAELWDQMTTEERLDFLFLPGFSTAGKVSDTSGRGFGLDIVKTGVEAIGGRILLRTEPGQGCQFEMDVPLTLSLTRCLLVKAGNHPLFDEQTCAFPVSDIDHVSRIKNADIREIEGHLSVRFQNETIRLFNLHSIIGLQSSQPDLSQKHLLVLKNQDKRFGLLVDAIIDEQDLVIQAIDERLGKVQDISAVSLLSAGNLALVMDIPDLIQRMNEGQLQLMQSLPAHDITAAEEAAEKYRILVVEDSITVREVERHFLQQAGYEVSTAVNGVDGLNKARAGNYDLIISDIDMPRMNGIEMISQLRELDKFKTIPIVVVSYKDRQEDRNAAMDAGANDYITKSEFDTDKMLELIKNLLYQEP